MEKKDVETKEELKNPQKATACVDMEEGQGRGRGHRQRDLRRQQSHCLLKGKCRIWRRLRWRCP